MIKRRHRFHGLGSLRGVYRRGQTVRSSIISLRYQINTGRDCYRAAVIVSKKVNKLAVRRNRIRRRVYEIIRLNEQKLRPDCEFIVTVFSDQIEAWSAARLAKEIKSLLKRAGLFER
ncbi:MAG: ribonuclease P protein component [Candidatus Saccharimonadales bacterium]